MRQNPASIRHKDLCALVQKLGFIQRRGRRSHVAIYRRSDLPHLLINLQPMKGHAKPYQVRQVLTVIDTYDLEKELEV